MSCAASTVMSGKATTPAATSTRAANGASGSANWWVLFDLHRFADLDELRDELACSAVSGGRRHEPAAAGLRRNAPAALSRSANSSTAIAPTRRHAAGPVRGWRDLLTDMLAPAVNPCEQAHLLETFLHAAPVAEMTDACAAFVRRWSELDWTTADLSALLRTLFNEVSLSPYTDLVEKTLTFLRALEARSLFQTEQVVDFLSYLLRHLGRHLTAYDLVVFHHRGANYPDALLLDAVLKEYLMLLGRRPELFSETPADGEDARRRKRIRRRALRQGWLLRRRYEGHPVPDLPTSAGENSRVLPLSHPRLRGADRPARPPDTTSLRRRSAVSSTRHAGHSSAASERGRSRRRRRMARAGTGGFPGSSIRRRQGRHGAGRHAAALRGGVQCLDRARAAERSDSRCRSRRRR